MRRLVLLNISGVLIGRKRVPDLRQMHFYFCPVIPEYVPHSPWLRNSISSPMDATQCPSGTLGIRKLPSLPVAESPLLSNPTLRTLPAPNATRSYLVCVCPRRISHHLYRHAWLRQTGTPLAWAGRRRLRSQSHRID